MNVYQRASIFIIILCSAFIVSHNSQAGLLGDYKVSKKATKVDQRRVVGSGSRSACEPSVKPKSIELIVPDVAVAHFTMSNRPPLYVYSSTNKQVKARFTLVDITSYETLVDREIYLKQGLKKIELPLPISLTDSKVYIWNVAIPCKNATDGYQTVLSAGIEKIIIPPQLDDNLSNSERIKYYDDNSIWYETVEASLGSAQSDLKERQWKEEIFEDSFNKCLKALIKQK